MRNPPTWGATLFSAFVCAAGFSAEREERKSESPTKWKAPDRRVPEIALAISIRPEVRRLEHPHGHSVGNAHYSYSLHPGGSPNER
jgi:hypothetical protein